MKQLSVPFLSFHPTDSICFISRKLDALPKNNLEYAPWKAYPYRPEVSFVIAFSDTGILLKYYVSEKFVQALYSQPNDPVYKDSCVEFFISLHGEPSYYNFEFSCAGTCLSAFGNDRHGRTRQPAEVIQTISHIAVLKPAGKGANAGWELAVQIPFSAFHFHHLSSLTLKSGRANFYKCGDDLPDPHYLSWNNILTEQPDFHRPEYFGNLVFEGE